MTNLNLPNYSDKLVNLARAYDRASLVCKTAAWHLSDLREYNPDCYGSDDDMAAYTEKRIDLLDSILPELLSTLNMYIQEESAAFFNVELSSGEMIFPNEVYDALKPYMHWVCHNNSVEICKENASKLSKDNHVIIFDDEVFILPKSYPASFIEVWWRRWWGGSEGLYELCLVPNPEYGWDCYGHER